MTAHVSSPRFKHSVQGQACRPSRWPKQQHTRKTKHLSVVSTHTPTAAPRLPRHISGRNHFRPKRAIVLHRLHDSTRLFITSEASNHPVFSGRNVLPERQPSTPIELTARARFPRFSQAQRRRMSVQATPMAIATIHAANKSPFAFLHRLARSFNHATDPADSPRSTTVAARLVGTTCLCPLPAATSCCCFFCSFRATHFSSSRGSIPKSSTLKGRT